MSGSAVSETGAYPLNSPSTADAPSGVKAKMAAEVASLEQSLWESTTEAFRTQWLGPLEEAGIRQREVFEEGRPVPVLLEVAEREQVDLIVTGRRGLGSVAEFLAGSVSHHYLGFLRGGSMGSVAQAINPAGVVVGGSDTSGGFSHATVWRLANGD